MNQRLRSLLTAVTVAVALILPAAPTAAYRSGEPRGTQIDPGADTDGDTVLDGVDNCVRIANPAQGDADGDGHGDACTPVEATVDFANFTYVVDVSAAVAWSSRTVAVAQSMRVTNTGSRPLRSLNLLSFPKAIGAWSGQVVTVDGTAVTPNAAGSLSINVPFATALQPGASVTVGVRGSINLSRAASRDPFGRVGYRDGMVILGEWMALPGKPVARTTIGDPISARTAGRITTTVTVNTTLRRAAVQASGERRAAPATSGRSWTFEIENARGAAIAIDPSFVERTRDDRAASGITFTTAGRSASRADAINGVATSAARSFTAWFGPTPYPTIRVIDSAFSIGNEWPGLVTVPRASTGGRLAYIVRHEVAHQWFYALIAGDQYVSPWVDEGFTEFAARLKGGTAPSTCSVKKVDSAITTYAAFAGSCNAYYETVYKRTTRMLWSIKNTIGTSTLLGCIKGFVAANRFRHVSGVEVAGMLAACDPRAAKIMASYLQPGTISPPR